jgi:uncharacterized protein
MNIIEKTIEFVKSELSGAEGGHDWWHTWRVLNLARFIAEKENADVETCELGALLHDIADPKFHSGDENIGIRIASEFLAKSLVPWEQSDAVLDIIKNISFSKSIEGTADKTLELQVVQDADRLDAMGAIGIARAFNYGGYKNRPMYDPLVKPVKHTDKQAYRNSSSPTINHFHEKLLLLKDLMNTETGRKLAERRHEYMLQFLNEFHKEWKGEL